MAREWTFIVPGKPVGNQAKQSAIVTNRKREQMRVHYTPAKTRNYHALVKMYASQAGIQLQEYIRLEIAICLPCRLKTYKTRPDEWLEPKVRPDTDNVKKIIKDAIQGIAIINDKNVLDDRAYYKFIPPGQQAYTEITVIQTDWREYWAEKLEAECRQK